MKVDLLIDRLFPTGHDLHWEDAFFGGVGQSLSGQVAVIGTAEKTAVGVDLALRISREVISIVKSKPGMPILMLVDTSGQKMSKRDELLGLNGYIAHLAKCFDLARRQGHRLIGLVHGEAVSAGFLSTSLLADECYALAEAEIRVMNLPAMSRITKIPLERLEELSRDSSVFAPGVDNYVAMGAVRAIWDGELDQRLEEALAGANDVRTDTRRIDGGDRGGRMQANKVASKVRQDAA